MWCAENIRGKAVRIATCPESGVDSASRVLGVANILKTDKWVPQRKQEQVAIRTWKAFDEMELVKSGNCTFAGNHSIHNRNRLTRRRRGANAPVTGNERAFAVFGDQEVWGGGKKAVDP